MKTEIEVSKAQYLLYYQFTDQYYRLRGDYRRKYVEDTIAIWFDDLMGFCIAQWSDNCCSVILIWENKEKQEENAESLKVIRDVFDKFDNVFKLEISEAVMV